MFYTLLVFKMPPYYTILMQAPQDDSGPLPLRVADKGVLVTTPISVAQTCSQQLLEGNGAPTTLSTLPSRDAAVGEGGATLCSSKYCKYVT